MSVERIQVRQVEAQRSTVQELTIGGVALRLRADYSVLFDRWYLSIFTLADVAIVRGIACVPGIDLLRAYKHLEIPQGQLFCSVPDREPPTFATMDVTAQVLYR